MKKSFFLTILGLTAGISMSHALVLQVDFGQAANSSGNWNHVTQATTVSNLVDFQTGSTTAASITVSAGPTFYGMYGDGFVSTGWVADTASGDNMGSYSTITVTLSGLGAGQAYQLEIVSSSVPGGGSYGYGTFLANEAYASRNHNNTLTNISYPWNESTARNNKDWLVWDSISANGSGQIVIQATPEMMAWVTMGALRLEAVPEPASIGIVSLAACAALIRRRRF